MLGTADIRVRPLKLALLVEPNNASQVREAIRLASSLWGGTYFPIVPLYKRRPTSWRSRHVDSSPIKEVVLGYLDAFDPDVLVQFSSELPTFLTALRLKVVKPAEMWAQAEPGADPEPRFGISALEVLGDIYNECFKYTPRFPTRVAIPSIPREMGLFWASVFGEYPEHFAKAVERHFAKALDLERPAASPDAFISLVKQRVLFPRRITSWETELHRSRRFGHHSSVFFMDASRVEDVVDYWNLRATGRNVIPLPKQLSGQESVRSFIQAFLLQEKRPWSANSAHFEVAHFVCSRNSSMDELQAYAKTLQFEGQNNDTRQPYALQHWYPRIWDAWARERDGGVASLYGTTKESIEIGSSADLNMHLKPLVPRFSNEDWRRSDVVCANEFDLRLYGADEYLAEVYPKSQGKHLSRAISGIAGTRGGWRIGRDGLVRLVSGSSSESRTVPAAESIFFAWLADQGWAAELSPPGILAKQIYKRLNGYPSVIAKQSILGLLEHMNGGLVSKNGTPGETGQFSAEREMSVAEVKSLLKGPDGHSSSYEHLLEKGVFKLGLRTQCPSCHRNSWFPISSLRESLECPKCLTAFPAAGNVEQKSSGWFYRTAGPFSVPHHADGAYAVLLTLDMLGDRFSTGLRTTSVPSFVAKSAGKASLEADLAMFWRETSAIEEFDGLLFGECKSFGPFQKKDFDRMRHLATTFPGAVLVFSTLREKLTKPEIAAIARLAKAGGRYWKADRPINPVLVLTGTELLTWERPPYCWSEENQERFSRVHDLLSLCAATQQLYLNIPSWTETWRKNFDKRAERSKQRANAKAQRAAG